MIEPPFRTLLMSAVGATPLTQARLSTAGDAAIALSPITVGAQQEQRATWAGQAKTLPQNYFAIHHCHAGSRAGLDSEGGFVAP